MHFVRGKLVPVFLGITASAALGLDDVSSLTVTSRDSENLVAWRNPHGSDYLFTRIIARTDRFATDASDTSGAEVFDKFGEKGNPDSLSHPGLVNDTRYYYTAFVGNGGGSFSNGVRALGIPIDTSGPLRWAFRAGEGATAMSPPGIGISVFAPSNDGRLYAMDRGDSGGNPPTKYKVVETPAPIQHRPAVIPVSVTAADHLTLLSSQDGFVRAIDAVSGDLLWTSQWFGMLQAGPAASLVDFGASRDLVFVGSRKTDQDNIFAAIKVEDGTGAWEYDDLASGQGIGIVNGGASVDYARGRVYFASHERASGANTVFALNLDDGALVWRRGLGDVSGSPIVRGSVLYVAADDGRIYALDAETGDDLAPAYPTADGVPKGFVFPDFASNRLFFATTGKLWCLQHREAALELVWSTSEIPSPSIPTVPSGSGYVWAGGGDGRLYQVDAVSGSPTALALADPATGIGSPSFDVLHRFLYVGSEDGAVYAVRAPF